MGHYIGASDTGCLFAILVVQVPRCGPWRQVRQAVLQEVVAGAGEIFLLDDLPLELRLAAGLRRHGETAERGLVVRVLGFVLLPLRLLRSLGLHHQLQPLALVERVPGHGPGPHLAEGPCHHGLPAGWPAPLERDALPRRAPHVPWPHWRHEPAWALPRVAESPRR